MNFAHIHIVLNHVPTLGTLVGVAVLILALVMRREDLQKFSLLFLMVMTLLVLPTYLTGPAAQVLLERNGTEVPDALLEAHQNSAILTLILMTLLGTLAWVGLWQFRRLGRPTSMNTRAVLVLGLLTAAVILRTSGMGGKISHPEIRADEAVVEVAAWQAWVEDLVSLQSWAWPAAETLHFVGMILVFGVALAINLRMLGVMKSVPYPAFHRLLPLGILGFVLNVITGMVFFVSSPNLYVGNPGFTMKIALILISGASVVYFTMFDGPWAIGEGRDAPLTARLAALGTMALVLGVMWYGRMLPFLA